MIEQTAESPIEVEFAGKTWKMTRLTPADFGELEDYVRSQRVALLKAEFKKGMILGEDDTYFALLQHIFDPRVEFTVLDDATLQINPRGMVFALYLHLRKHQKDITPEWINDNLPVAEMMRISNAINGLLQPETAGDTEEAEKAGPDVG